MQDKILILQSDEEFKVNLLKLKLENSGVPCWVINKHDSSYKTFGDLELYVNKDDVELAKEIISEGSDNQ